MDVTHSLWLLAITLVAVMECVWGGRRLSGSEGSGLDVISHAETGMAE